MKTRRSPHLLTATALAASLMLAACGGGSGEAPPPAPGSVADATGPVVTITDSVVDATATGDVTFSFTFNEDVGTSFAAEDVTVTGGAKGAFTRVDGQRATLVVTPTANSTGTIVISVPASAAVDARGNGNALTTSQQDFNTVVVVPPPATGTVVLANFDTVTPTVAGFEGAEGSAIEAGPAGGGSGLSFKLLRSGGQVFALGIIETTVPVTATRRTVSAQVYSPTAGIPMILKLEGPGGANTGDVAANEPVVVGWQTLTWTLTSADPTRTYNKIVLLPNLGTVDAAPGKAYFFDSINLQEAAPPPPPVTGTVLANFDDVTPTAAGFEGAEGSAIEAGPAGGGSGLSFKVLRSGGQVYALGIVETTVPITATRRTVSAQVYSPTAGIPMILKLEGPGGANTGDVAANEAVVVGWQTLTWTFTSADPTRTYNKIVLLPNLGTVDAPPGKAYFFDNISLQGVAPPPTPTGTVLANFDDVTPTAAGFEGAEGSAIEAGPAGGGSGLSFKVLRSGGQVYALGIIETTVAITATRRTVSAQVYSPTAGIPMILKLEGPGGANTGDVAANEAVVVGWQTLTWTFTSANPSSTYNKMVLLPNLGTVDAAPGKAYFFDDVKLLDAVAGGGGSGPSVEMGAGGPQPLTIATGDIKTGDGGNTMFVAGEGLFAVNFVGSAETFAPFNLAAYPNAKTANFAAITGISGGDIGFFQDDVNLSNSSQKVDELGWITGTSYAPNGVPNFFRTFVLKGPVSNSAYMGLYMNAPNNGTVNVSSFSKLKIKVWGPGPMFERTNLNPVLEITLVGPKVAGCATGSGGSEITQNLTANQKNGAGGFYTLPLSGFTVKTLCSGDSNAASVLAKLARVVVTVPGTSFNYTNLDGGNYATGLNLGPVGFTNN